MPAMMRSLSSCLEVTRMWRRTERANLEKKPSMRLSQEPCLGVKVSSKRPAQHVASHALVSLEDAGGMIIEDQFDRGTNCCVDAILKRVVRPHHFAARSGWTPFLPRVVANSCRTKSPRFP